LDELGFAVWWMDDGSTASLGTHAFTVLENEIIVAWLQEWWGIAANISMDRRVQRPFLTFRQPNVSHLLRLVAPHVIPSLESQFGSESLGPKTGEESCRDMSSNLCCRALAEHFVDRQRTVPLAETTDQERGGGRTDSGTDYRDRTVAGPEHRLDLGHRQIP
jgi:hypothetical protein